MSFIDRLQALAGQGKVLHRDAKASEGDLDLVYDTRKVSGDPSKLVFVALKGANRDGHSFLLEAHKKGIRHFIVSDVSDLKFPGNYLMVKDTLAAVQALAANWRQKDFFPEVIGITGSNGKTIVKDWLGILWSETGHSVYQSPRSYNSQLGVALSLLNYREKFKAEHFLLELGISLPGEMERLQRMAQPTIGIMTHFGDAHDEGFSSREEKLQEKLKLFLSCQKVYVSTDQEEVFAALQETSLELGTVGWSYTADLQLMAAHPHSQGWKLQLKWQDQTHTLNLPVPGEAALENALLCLRVLLDYGIDFLQLQKGLDRLLPVEMRMEMITDNPEIAVINDSWNSDRISIGNAFAMLTLSRAHPRQMVVLTDLEQQGKRQKEIQQEVLEEAIARFGKESIILIGDCYTGILDGDDLPRSYPDLGGLLKEFNYDDFRHSTVLLKGARRYRLERLIPYLSQRAVASSFRINMNALRDNYLFFRGRVPKSVKMMVMVKANAYGSGNWEIAGALAAEGADYLTVAYTSEGIELRKRGIKLPIMVLNADLYTFEQVLRYDLEPEISRWSLLEACLRTAQSQEKPLSMHIKVDTGMSRLGFGSDEGKSVAQFLNQHSDYLHPASLLSHLAAADEEDKEAFTHSQVERFERFCQDFEEAYEGEKPLRHLLNTAGILRYPEQNYDMVRLGIGLYGISPIAAFSKELSEIGTLQSLISQVHEYPSGTAIGYGCSDITQRDSRIGIVPIGYADGIRRSLSNGKFSLLVRGQRAPIIGRICMDMLMLDLTEIPEAGEGDEVVILGKQGKGFISVNEMAEACDTIPYEILTGIGQRVRRVYISE